MTIDVTIKNVYGNEMIYPACETAEKFCELIGKKTFSQSDMMRINELGYTMNVVAALGVIPGVRMVLA